MDCEVSFVNYFCLVPLIIVQNLCYVCYPQTKPVYEQQEVAKAEATAQTKQQRKAMLEKHTGGLGRVDDGFGAQGRALFQYS